MLELTKQERQVIVFLLATGLLGVGIVCYKSLTNQPKIEIVSNQEIDKEVVASRVVNINTATRGELIKLSGIGPAMADAIIEYRRSHGSFRNKEELKNVRGIGPVKFDKLKENIKVE